MTSEIKILNWVSQLLIFKYFATYLQDEYAPSEWDHCTRYWVEGCDDREHSVLNIFKVIRDASAWLILSFIKNLNVDKD